MVAASSSNKPIPYLWLDLIRGVAAIAVFTGHLRVLCIDDTPMGKLDILGKSVFFITGFGHIAVIIFFVLSGFLIIKSVHESYLRGSFTFASYSKNRISRLWTVLIPCLIIGFALDKLGLQYFSYSMVYSGESKYFLNNGLENNLSPNILFGNLFFLQTILVPTFGSNGPLWSLCNEFWYYVVFPFIYLGLQRHTNTIIRLIYIFTAVVLLFFVGAKISLFFIIWLYGGLSYLISIKVNKQVLTNSWLRIGLVVAFIVFISLTRSKVYPQLFNNYTVGIIFALLIPFLIQINIKNRVAIWISTYLSNISYTLYLAHLPFIFFITSIANFQGKLWNLENCAYLIGYISATMLYATLIWYLFERNTTKIKNWVFGKSLGINLSNIHARSH